MKDKEELLKLVVHSSGIFVRKNKMEFNLEF